MIEIKNLTLNKNNIKSLLHKKRILDNVSCTINNGCTFGIVGKAGAGKSFILKTLLGLLKPYSGTILIVQKPPAEYLQKNSIGYLAKHPFFYKHLKAHEILSFYSSIIQPKSPKRDELVNELIEKVNLTHIKGSKIADYTEGMLRRLGIAKAILHKPKLLLLDEPFYNLDPVGRNVVLKILTELKQIGTTIIFCSHNLYDIEALCDEIAIFDNGRVIKQGTIENVLPNSISGIEIIIEIPKNKKLKEIEEEISIIDISSDQIKLFVPEMHQLTKILQFMQKNSIEIRSIKTLRQTLEDFFMKLLPKSEE